MRPRGFTLVECATACTVLALLTLLAVPSYLGQERRSARLDAVQALERVQSEQEQYRTLHGMYAGELAALRGVRATSAQGRYSLSLQRTSADAYRVVALAEGVQRQDRDCPQLALEVKVGFPNYGPKPACWNR